MTTFLQLHGLFALPLHNANRDENGRPKTMLYGGVTRGRISSQARKRAIRFGPHFDAGGRAIRTRQKGAEAARDLMDVGVPWEKAMVAGLMIGFAIGGSKNKPFKTLKEGIKGIQQACKPPSDPNTKDKSPGSEGGDGDDMLKNTKKRFNDAYRRQTNLNLSPDDALHRARLEALRTEQGLVISQREIAGIKELVERLKALVNDEAALDEALEKFIEPKSNSLLSKEETDLDIALFGRMVASAPGYNVEAACAVSHMVTTHPFTVEADYFSAGEELAMPELPERGAAITDFAFQGAGVYYQHAVLAWDDLLTSLKDEKLAREGAGRLLEGFAHAMPRGKRNAHSHDVPAQHLVAEVGDFAPFNLMNAFLDPVANDGDVMTASVARLRAHHATLRSAFGGGDKVEFAAWPPLRLGNEPPEGEVWTFGELLDRVQARLPAGAGA
ncbi:MAG: type I-E CRISPR-associated protein Cas7/Cse4/CasC [Geminicoccaceae bacterium]|nr:type I-E CRISPR-associated protein Cas7/Cse4/CasC [Geminicoccaceae bacterium]